MDTRTRSDIGRPEAQANPIFVLLIRTVGARCEQVDSVWSTREEAEAWANSRSYNWRSHRVYCVSAKGRLIDILNASDPVPDGAATPIAA